MKSNNNQNFYNKKIHKKNFNSDVASLLWIVNKQFWKSWLSPFFAFLFPVFFISILGGLFGYNIYFGSMLTIASASVGLISLPQAIFEFKSSILLKRIGSTKITIKKFLFTIVSYYFLIMAVATIFSFLMSLVLFSSFWHKGKSLGDASFTILSPLFENVKIKSEILATSFEGYLKNIDYVGAIYSFLVGFGVSAALGIFVASIAKSTSSLQAIAVPILILSQFLSAQVMALQFLVPVAPLRYLGYFTPFKGTTSTTIEAFQGQPIDTWHNTFFVESKNFGEYLNSKEFLQKMQEKYPFLTQANVDELVKAIYKQFNINSSNFSTTLIDQDFATWFTKIQEFMGQEITKYGTLNNNNLPVNDPLLTPEGGWKIFGDQEIIFNVTRILTIQKTSPFNIYSVYKITDKAVSDELIEAFTQTEKILNLIIPWLWIGGLWAISLKTFKWDAK